MTRPWPLRPDFPSPDFTATAEPLFPAEPLTLCAGPRKPDAAWTRSDGKRVEAWLEPIGKRCLLCWRLDGVAMDPSDHSSVRWAQEEMDRWRERDTLAPVVPVAGEVITLASGKTAELLYPSFKKVFGTVVRGWMVRPISGFRAGQKPFVVAMPEVEQALRRPEGAVEIDTETGGKVIDLMAALKASLAKQPGPGAA